MCSWTQSQLQTKGWSTTHHGLQGKAGRNLLRSQIRRQLGGLWEVDGGGLDRGCPGEGQNQRTRTPTWKDEKPETANGRCPIYATSLQAESAQGGPANRGSQPLLLQDPQSTSSGWESSRRLTTTSTRTHRPTAPIFQWDPSGMKVWRRHSEKRRTLPQGAIGLPTETGNRWIPNATFFPQSSTPVSGKGKPRNPGRNPSPPSSIKTKEN